MKDLLSHRFSLDSQNDLPYLSPDQVKNCDLVRGKIKYGYGLASNPCPCSKGGPDDDTIISEIDRYGLPLHSVLCTQCGTVRIDPYLDEKSLADFYTNYYQEMYGRSIKVDAYFEKQKQYGKKFHIISEDFLQPGSDILEFGCGAGGALQIFKHHGHQVYGIEYSQKLLDYGISRSLKNLYYGSIEDAKGKIGTTRFDLIFSNHVFEHVNFPLRYLENCIELLKPEGRIICAVPDIYGSRKYIFPNSDLRMMLHIAHIYNYSFECLQDMARKLDVEIRRLFPDEKVITPTSVMPELWFEIVRKKGVTASVPDQARKRSITDKLYLRHLKETESNFLNKKNLLIERKSIKEKIKIKLKHLLPWKK